MTDAAMTVITLQHALYNSMNIFSNFYGTKQYELRIELDRKKNE
ncbi:MAG: hypothetical protein WAZ77_06130 [Candidatus Nitrosopolaris sp.]